MKRKLISIISILLMILFAIMYIKEKLKTPYDEIIYLNWQINLPTEYEEIYSLDSGPSFHGDGERYHIFQYKKEDRIGVFLFWENRKNREIEKEVKEILWSLKVPKDKKPNFQKPYYYYIKRKIDFSNIYLIFFMDTKKLYIIERLL